jgi:hypothetical protein
VQKGLPADARPGCLVADDAAAFASHVIELLRISPDERRRRAGLTPVQTLQWSEQLRDLEAIFRQALSSSRHVHTESHAHSGS